MTRLLAEIQRINQTVSIADSEGMEYEDAYSTARSMSEGEWCVCVFVSLSLCACVEQVKGSRSIRGTAHQRVWSEVIPLARRRKRRMS